MRSLAACGALAMMLACGPAAAGDAWDELAATRAANVVTPGAASAAVAGSLNPSAGLPAPPPPITLVLKADLGAQRLTVIENGKPKYTWAISSGRRGYATKTGTFKPQWASRMWYSRQYEYAPMPHAVFFHRGTAFHGTSAVGMLGRPASHGCVRLAPGNAATLFKLVHKHGYPHTKIIVHGDPRFNEPAVARRQRDRGVGEARVARQGERGQRQRKANRRYATQQSFTVWPF